MNVNRMPDNDSKDISIAWLSRGKLFVRRRDGSLHEIESDFARQALSRELRDSQQNAWKGRSGVWGNLGMQPPGVAPWETADPRRVIRFSAIARGAGDQELLYVLDLGGVGGLFRYDLATETESRLIHRQGFVLKDLARSPREDGELIVSLPRDDGTVGLKVTRSDGLFGRDLALSDTLDEAPSWLSDGTRRIVFQSTAILRNEQGFAVGRSPSRIELLDLDSQSVSSILEEHDHDLLQPRQLPDGTLIFIRRPWKAQMQQSARLVDVMKDIVFFPYRVARTGVHFLHFLSMMFSGKPLITAGTPDPGRSGANPWLMLWGQAVDTRQALQRKSGGPVSAPLVPKDWQLLKRTATGEQTVLADHVTWWDLGSDGRILYSNGRAIFRIGPSGNSEPVLESDLVERFVVLS